MNTLFSLLRLGIGLVYMAIAVLIFAALCTILLPWRSARIRVCNIFGHITGRFILWLAGATVHGADLAKLQAVYPAIYVSNHTSALDIFLGIWLGPVGVCGVAKKEVVWYPFFGQLYALSGHLLIDRQNRENAIAALKRAAEDVKRYHLAIWMWPEGTRARDGRLQPFKKGFAHLALATGLPVVPIVVSGAHRAWQKNSMHIHPTDIRVQVMDPIPTTGWSNETLERNIEEVHAVFASALPPDQLPEVKIPA